MDVPEEDNDQISKRKAIQVIMQDSSLTSQEKQKQIQKFMSTSRKVHENSSIPPRRGIKPLRPRMVARVGASNSAVNEDVLSRKADILQGRRRKRATGLDSSTKLDKLEVQGRKTLSSARRSTTEGSTRHELMRSIMADINLTVEEKQQKLQEIMSGGNYASDQNRKNSKPKSNIREISHGSQSLLRPQTGESSGESSQTSQEQSVDRLRSNQSASNVVGSRVIDPEFQESSQTSQEQSVDQLRSNQSASNVVGSRVIDPEFQAYVPEQAWQMNNLVATNVVTQAELEDDEVLKRRRYMWYGVCILCVFLILVILPIVILVPNDVDEIPTFTESESLSQFPSSAPTTTALLDLMKELENIYPTQDLYRKAFAEYGTPQYRAAIWATSTDNSEGLPGDNSRLLTRFALASFYFATNGDNWLRCARSGSNCNLGEEWLSIESECSWFSIECNDNNVVQGINFKPTGNRQGNNIAGTLPFELSLLTSLKTLIVRSNSIEGSIPDSWTGLTNLELVSLGENELTGPVPELLINNNPNLWALFLDHNKLSDELPSSLMSTALKTLKLNGNEIRGTIPPGFAGLGNLERLYLNDNSLSGSIPSSISNMKNLTHLSLQGNHLTGSVPAEICSLNGPDYLNLQYLTVDCPQVSCNCCNNCP